MRHVIAILAVLGTVALGNGGVQAGKLEDDIRGLWLGAWVVLEVEATSDCGGSYTNNRVNGNLVRGNGRHRFGVGELAKINKLDIKRSRLDLLLSLDEPYLVSYGAGPFTLYREVSCKIELEVEIPREVVKNKEVGPVEDALVAIFERHATEDDARASNLWNEREREDYPDDYELTLAKLEVWRAEQTNAAVQTKLDDAHAQTLRLADRVMAEQDYLAGFARGVESAKAVERDECPALLAIDIGNPPGKLSSDDIAPAADQDSFKRGFRDGKQLVFGLAMMRRLPDCFVQVPELPEGLLAAAD